MGIVDECTLNASIHAGCEIPTQVSTRGKWWVCAKIQHFYPLLHNMLWRDDCGEFSTVRGGEVACTHA